MDNRWNEEIKRRFEHVSLLYMKRVELDQKIAEERQKLCDLLSKACFNKVEAPKEVSKEAPKEVSKETPKEAPKEVSKEVSKEGRVDITSKQLSLLRRKLKDREVREICSKYGIKSLEQLSKDDAGEVIRKLVDSWKRYK